MSLLLSLYYMFQAEAGAAQDPYSTGYKWGRTELDSVVSVRTPVRGEPGQDPRSPWCVAFTTTSHYNRFFMVRLDYPASPQFGPVLKDGTQTMILDMDKFFRLYIKTDYLQFSKPRLTGELTVSLPTAPSGSSMHRTYSGRDEITQSPSTLEATWFMRANVLYMFICTTVDMQTPQANEEKMRFFSTITIREK